MNVQKVPKTILDKIAGFPVASLFDDRKEVSLLGEDFYKVKSIGYKDFWRAYRKIMRCS